MAGRRGVHVSTKEIDGIASYCIDEAQTGTEKCDWQLKCVHSSGSPVLIVLYTFLH